MFDMECFECRLINRENCFYVTNAAISADVADHMPVCPLMTFG